MTDADPITAARRLLIVWHSKTGNTAALRDAVLVAEKARVAEGTLTQAELDAGGCPMPRPALVLAPRVPLR